MASDSQRPRVALDERLIAPGQWKEGRIFLSRSLIREVARETGISNRRVLHDTAYHEAFHGCVEPFGRLVSRCLGVDDIYETSYESMVYGQGQGYWYRTEEWAAEVFGRWCSRRRERFQRRRKP